VIDVGPPGDDNFVPPGGDQHVGGQNFPPSPQQQFLAPGQQWWIPPWVQPQPRAMPPHVQQPAPPVAQPHKVKLTKFWTHNPAVWFAHEEALFQTYYVVEDVPRSGCASTWCCPCYRQTPLCG